MNIINGLHHSVSSASICHLSKTHFLEMFSGSEWAVCRCKPSSVWIIRGGNAEREILLHSSSLCSASHLWCLFPFKEKHEFNIAAVYLGPRLRRLSNVGNFLRPCCLELFSSSKLFCGSSQRTRWHFFQRLTVELTSDDSVPSYLTGTAALESNCLTSIFHQPSLKKARRARRTSPWRLVWVWVMLSVIHLAASGHSELRLWTSFCFVHQFLPDSAGRYRSRETEKKRFHLSPNKFQTNMFNVQY